MIETFREKFTRLLREIKSRFFTWNPDLVLGAISTSWFLFLICMSCSNGAIASTSSRSQSQATQVALVSEIELPTNVSVSRFDLNSKIKTKKKTHIAKTPNGWSEANTIGWSEANTICKFLHRYVDCSTKNLITDPSAVELLDGYGLHGPTHLGFGVETSLLRIPGIPKTLELHLSRMILDTAANVIHKKNNRIKSIIQLINDCVKIDYFATQTVTRPSQNAISKIMYEKTRVNHVHHELMRSHFLNLVGNHNHNRLVLNDVNNHLGWSEQLMRIIDPNGTVEIPDVMFLSTYRSLVRQLELELFPKDNRLQTHCETDGRTFIYGGQIKTQNSGVLAEIDLLHLFCTMAGQRNLFNEHLKQRISICVRNTRTQSMNTSLFEVKSNLTHIVSDGIRLAINQIPVVKRSAPVINSITEFAEKYMPFELYYQFGSQKSNSVNFNNELETSRTEGLNQYNLEIQQQALHHNEQTLLHPRTRKDFFRDVPEINCGHFSHTRCMLMYNFSAFDILERITAARDKLRS